MDVRNAKPLRDILGLGPAEIAITLVVGLVLSIGGPTVAEIGNSIATAAAVTAVVVLATSVLAAVHRQFRRLERSGPSVPPTA
mgnify:CR=1 FL=1